MQIFQFHRAALILVFTMVGVTAHAGRYVAADNTPCAVYIPFQVESLSWHGACLHGYAQGHGTLRRFLGKDRQGEIVTKGYFERGRLEGQGWQQKLDTYTYFGNYSASEWEGFGVITFHDLNHGLVKAWNADPMKRGHVIDGNCIFTGVFEEGNFVRACPDPAACGLELPRSIKDAPPVRGRALSLN